MNDEKQLVGYIGSKELNSISQSPNTPLDSIIARNIMNTRFSSVSNSANYRNECFEIFGRTGIYNIPIVDSEKRLINVVNRSECKMNMLRYTSTFEDLILQYVFFDTPKIFYIDVGAYDPVFDSVTKWLYESNKGTGINIEPQLRCYNRLVEDRPNDINIQAACGDKHGTAILHVSNEMTDGVIHTGGTTLIDEYSKRGWVDVNIDVIPLRDICKEYVPTNQPIHFLKIDVEGYEKQVMLGADFENFRPWLITVESTIPGTDINVHDKWESILLSNNYTFVRQYNINRYYVANEQAFLSKRFIDLRSMKKMINSYYPISERKIK